MTLLLVGRVADLHPGHLRCAADPHLLGGSDLTLPAGFSHDGSQQFSIHAHDVRSKTDISTLTFLKLNDKIINQTR